MHSNNSSTVCTPTVPVSRMVEVEGLHESSSLWYSVVRHQQTMQKAYRPTNFQGSQTSTSNIRNLHFELKLSFYRQSNFHLAYTMLSWPIQVLLTRTI